MPLAQQEKGGILRDKETLGHISIELEKLYN